MAQALSFRPCFGDVQRVVRELASRDQGVESGCQTHFADRSNNPTAAALAADAGSLEMRGCH